jgi:recombination protein RecT
MKTDGSDQNTKGQAGNGNPKSESEKAADSLKAQIAKMSKEFERALPDKIGVERMMRIVMTAILKNPQLAICEPNTFFGALLNSLQLGLEVNTPLGQAYLIPRKKNDKNGRFLYWECTLQLGYQGLLELCYRSNRYDTISARIVYEGDDFKFRYGSSQYLRHTPRYTSDKPEFAYGYYKLKDGNDDFVVWKYADALKHGEEFSDAFTSKYSPWQKNAETQEAMVRKTMIKQVLHYAPKSVELAQAFSSDGHAIVANKYEDDGGAQLHFEVKQLEPPNQEDREFMAKVNAGGTRGTDKDPVPASPGRKDKQEQKTAGAETTTPRSQPGTGTSASTGKGDLFSSDEEADLEEQYMREHEDVDGPDFVD